MPRKRNAKKRDFGIMIESDEPDEPRWATRKEVRAVAFVTLIVLAVATTALIFALLYNPQPTFPKGIEYGNWECIEYNQKTITGLSVVCQYPCEVIDTIGICANNVTWNYTTMIYDLKKYKGVCPYEDEYVLDVNKTEKLVTENINDECSNWSWRKS